MTMTSANSFTLAAIEKHIMADSIANALVKMCKDIQDNCNADQVVVSGMHDHAIGYIQALRDLTVITREGHQELVDGFDWEYSMALTQRERQGRSFINTKPRPESATIPPR